MGHGPADLRIGQAGEAILQPGGADLTRHKAADRGLGFGDAGFGRTAQMAEEGCKTGGVLAPRRQMMIGQQGVGGLGRQLPEGGDRAVQHLQHQTRILFGVVHMARLQAPVVIMLDQVVVGVAGRGQRIQPQRVDRCRAKGRQTRPVGHQMRQIVAQDVVADQMGRTLAECFQPVEGRRKRPALMHEHLLTAHRRKGKESGSLWINLQIDRNTAYREGDGIIAQVSRFRRSAKGQASY